MRLRFFVLLLLNVLPTLSMASDEPRLSDAEAVCSFVASNLNSSNHDFFVKRGNLDINNHGRFNQFSISKCHSPAEQECITYPEAKPIKRIGPKWETDKPTRLAVIPYDSRSYRLYYTNTAQIAPLFLTFVSGDEENLVCEFGSAQSGTYKVSKYGEMVSHPPFVGEWQTQFRNEITTVRIGRDLIESSTGIALKYRLLKSHGPMYLIETKANKNCKEFCDSGYAVIFSDKGAYDAKLEIQFLQHEPDISSIPLREEKLFFPDSSYLTMGDALYGRSKWPLDVLYQDFRIAYPIRTSTTN